MQTDRYPTLTHISENLLGNDFLLYIYFFKAQGLFKALGCSIDVLCARERTGLCESRHFSIDFSGSFRPP